MEHPFARLTVSLYRGVAKDMHVEVVVNWIRTGDEEHFQYGPPNTDLWALLFDPMPGICRSPTQGSWPLSEEVVKDI